VSDVQIFEEFGFPWPNNLIMSYVGGSTAHGAKLVEKADTDYYGVFIEPAYKILGIDAFEHFVHTTGTGHNTVHDVDICLYSLRKWAGLAAKGNPSSLHFLFAPRSFTHPLWDYIQYHRDSFLSRNHIRPFMGFADDQMKRLFGEKGQKNCNRAQDELEFGYDTKYAMHVIRLYSEAKELMETGIITLPRPDKDLLIDIRRGKYKLFEIREMGTQLEREAMQAADKSPLPPAINREKVSKMVAEVYQAFWGGYDL